MTVLDVIEYLGYCLGCFGVGYAVGFQILAIKRFMDAI